MRRVILPSLLAFSALLTAAEKTPTDKLLRMAQLHSPDLEHALRDTFTDPKDDKLAKGTAYAGEHGQFLFAVASDKQPFFQVNQTRPEPATRAGSLWIYQGPLKQGTSYRYSWIVDGKVIGGANDVASFTEESYPQPGVPQGKLSEAITIGSKLYPGLSARMWYYVPAQWDGRTPLPVQFWGDGQFYIASRNDAYHLLDTFDNLFAEKRIPLMANVFVEPGTAPQRNIRSIEYDTVDDRFARYVLEEVFPEVEKHVPLRKDGYSRAMVGESSGGICAFNAAFLKPDQFSRVLSWIGSFAALQTSDQQPTGGAAYPILVRRTEKKNIRVWLQDGAEDQENPRAGSWPLANIHLANSLKLKGYDYHFSFGVGTHSQRQGSAELPESLVWLWRGYDSSKTSEEFAQDAGEKDKPMWRVLQLNRD
ncbi:MAG: alpha/beta hydrolase-fold protein [Acidobacteriota bacterium]